MLIAAFQKMTLLDYPGKIAALVFTQGCNFACGYCHNAEMIPKIRILPDSSENEPEAIFSFLSRRKGLLDGVVISGGEPTLQEGLDEFIRRIKKLGFLVKLDSNGSNPEVLQQLIDENLLDYIAMDLKQCSEKYRDLVKNDCSKEIAESIQLIMNSGIDYEFRSTILPFQHHSEDIESMGEMIMGAKKWSLQNFRSLKTLDRAFQDKRSFTLSEMQDLQKIAQKYAKLVELRNAS